MLWVGSNICVCGDGFRVWGFEGWRPPRFRSSGFEMRLNASRDRGPRSSPRAWNPSQGALTVQGGVFL